MKICLIIDVGCLVHRAYHAIGSLEFDDQPTGVLYGFFNSLQMLEDKFAPDVVAHCFDSKTNKRRVLLPSYKSSRRKDVDSDEQNRRQELHKQTALLPDLLRDAGYSNIYEQDGYEADDLIAVICRNYQGTKIIVSSDHDLYQLLNTDTIVWGPHSRAIMNCSRFIKEYDIQPECWWHVLALAGCSTDDVPGIKGVGEKIAVKYLNGTLGEHTATYKKIVDQGAALVHRNTPLVRLPFAGCQIPPIQSDAVTDALWDAMVGDLGMGTLRRRRR